MRQRAVQEAVRDAGVAGLHERPLALRSAGSVKNSCRAKTLHTCGLPGSSFRTRAGSVTAVRSRAHSSSGSATIAAQRRNTPR